MGADLNAIKSGKSATTKKANFGITLPDTAIIFEKGEGSQIFLAGKAKGKMVKQSIINPDWDFTKMGVGGLDIEFNAIFRRAFASRVFPPEVMEQLGCKHVKGRSIVVQYKKFILLRAFIRYLKLKS